MKFEFENSLKIHQCSGENPEAQQKKPKHPKDEFEVSLKTSHVPNKPQKEFKISLKIYKQPKTCPRDTSSKTYPKYTQLSKKPQKRV